MMRSGSEVALARAVLIHGPLSRSALTSRLELSAASLTRLAKPLIDHGIIVELDEVVDGSVGRPSRPLDMSPDAGSFIGIKLTGDRLFGVATTMRADPLGWIELPIEDRSPSAVVSTVLDAVRALDVSDLAGVGVSLGGFVRDGVVEHAPFLCWDGVDLAALLGARLDAPISVENDVLALTEAHRWFGVGRDLSGFALVTIGAGVGYGLVVAGETVATNDASAGTGGHIPLDPAGPICPDGHRGCARAMLTAGSIAAQVSVSLERPVSFDDVLALAEAGEAAATSVVEAAGEALGRLIALACNLSLQSTVVLAGEGVGMVQLFEERMRAAIDRERDPRALPVEVHVDSTGFGAWARGAAAVAIQAAIERLANE